MREIVAHLRQSKWTVSKMSKHLFILHLDNVMPLAGMVRFGGGGGGGGGGGRILIIADQRDIECHKAPRRNHGPSLATAKGCSGPPASSSIHFVGQLHTPKSATRYGTPDSVQCDLLQWPILLRKLTHD